MKLTPPEGITPAEGRNPAFLVKDGKVYAGCNGMIYVLDAATGDVSMRESLGAINSSVGLTPGPDGVYAAMAGSVAVIPFSSAAAPVRGKEQVKEPVPA